MPGIKQAGPRTDKPRSRTFLTIVITTLVVLAIVFIIFKISDKCPGCGKVKEVSVASATVPSLITSPNEISTGNKITKKIEVVA